MTNFYILVAINLIISTFYSLIINTNDSFSFINASFFVGMIYLLMGLFCFVYEKGFFNITMYSFSKISQDYKKRRGILVEEQASFEDYISRDNSFFLTNPLLWCGTFTSIICIVISFIMI